MGSLPFGIVADKIGRKYTLLALGVPHLICYGILAFAKDISLYYVARVLAGISVGATYTVLPLYIGEIAQNKNRGLLSSSINIFITGGDLIPYIIGPYLPIMWFNIVLFVFPVVFLVSFTFFAPESPYYHIIKKEYDAAETSLSRLRNKSSKFVKAELEEMKDSVKMDGETNLAGLLKALKEVHVRKAVIIAVALIVFQQLSGITAILLYTETLFESTGSIIPASESSLVLGAVQFIVSFILPPFVDRAGRKPMLIFSGVGMFLSEAALGCYLYIQDYTDINVEELSWLPVTTLVVYMITYNCGFGPLPYTIISEVFPSNVKGAASSACSLVCWILAFVVSKYFGSLQDWMGISGVFWLFGGCCLFAAIFVLAVMPETKGKSFQEIQTALGA